MSWLASLEKLSCAFSLLLVRAACMESPRKRAAEDERGFSSSCRGDT